jgi:hypothetical protein
MIGYPVLKDERRKMTSFSMMTAAIAGATVLASAVPAMAADQPGKSVCLSMISIDHTEIPNDRAILFYMRGHKVYKADLINGCPDLKFSNRGFTYSPTDPGSNRICSNLLTIRVNDTGNICLVGDITLVQAPEGKASP